MSKAPQGLRGKAFRSRKFAFRIDEEQAYRKLREFRVTQPQRYVLELILAGIAAGASYVEIETGVWQTSVHFDGTPFTVKQLESLYHHLIEQGETGTTAVSHLASALIMISHLEPRSVEIISGTAQLVETYTGNDEPERQLDTVSTAPRTTVVLKKQRTLQWLQLLGFRDTDEEAIVRHSACFCEIPIRVDGELVAPDISDLAVHMNVSDERGRALIGLQRDYALSPPIRICYRGVEITSATLDGIGGYLSSPQLTRNISLNAAVVDDHYHALLQLAQEHTADLEIALADSLLSQAGDRHHVDFDKTLAESKTIQKLARCLLPRHSLSAADPTRLRLEELPLLQTVNYTPISFRALRQAPGRRSWPWSGHAGFAFADLPSEHLPSTVVSMAKKTVLLLPSDRQPDLRELVESACEDVTSALIAAIENEAFLQRRTEPITLSGHLHCLTSLDNDDATGMFGLSEDLFSEAAQRAKSRVRVLHQHRYLYTHRKAPWQKSGLIPGVVGVINLHQYSPSENYRSVEGEDLTRFWSSVQAGMRLLLRSLVYEWPWATQPWALDALLWGLANELESDAETIAHAEALDVVPTLHPTRKRSLAELRIPKTDIRFIPTSFASGAGPDGAGEQLRLLRALIRGSHPAEDILVLTPSTVLALKGLGIKTRNVEHALRKAILNQKNTPRHGPTMMSRRWPHMAPNHPVHGFEEGTLQGAIGRSRQAPWPPGEIQYYRDRYRIGPSSASKRSTRDTQRQEAGWFWPALTLVIEWDELPTRMDQSDVWRTHQSFRELRKRVGDITNQWIDSLAPHVQVEYLCYHYEYSEESQPAGMIPRKMANPTKGVTIPLDPHRVLPPASWLDRPLIPCLDGVDRSLNELAALCSTEKPLGIIQSAFTRPPDRPAPMTMPDESLIALLDKSSVVQSTLPTVDVSGAVERERMQRNLLLKPVTKAHLRDRTGAPRHALPSDLRTSWGARLTGELSFSRSDRVELLFQGRPLASLKPELGWIHIHAVLDLSKLPSRADSNRDRSLLPTDARSELIDLVRNQATQHLLTLCEHSKHSQTQRAQDFLLHWLDSKQSEPKVRGQRGAILPWFELEALPMFTTFGGDAVSCDDLAQRLVDSPGIPFVRREVGEGAGSGPPDVLFVTRPQLHLLTHRFTQEKLIDVVRLDARKRKRAAARQRAQETKARQKALLRQAPHLDTSHFPETALVGKTVNQSVDGFTVQGVAWIEGPGTEALDAPRGSLRIALEGREIHQSELRSTHYRWQAHLACDQLILAADGDGIVENDAHAAVVLCAESVSAQLRRKLFGKLRDNKLDEQRATAARCILISYGRERHLEQGRAALHGRSKATFNIDCWPRADGQGHVNLRTLLEDFLHDGQVGHLKERAPDPSRLGRNLAIIVTNPEEHRQFSQLFSGRYGPKDTGSGWVDYSPRLVAPLPEEAPPAPPPVRLEAALKTLLDKAARCLDIPRHQERVQRWSTTIQLEETSEQSTWLDMSIGLRLQPDHPRSLRLLACLEGGTDCTLPLLACFGASDEWATPAEYQHFLHHVTRTFAPDGEPA